MKMLRAEFGVEEEVIQRSISQSQLLDQELVMDQGQMGRARKADTSGTTSPGGTQPATLYTVTGTVREAGNGAVPTPAWPPRRTGVVSTHSRG